LTTFRPDGEEIDVQLVKPVTVIGRAEDCDLELPLPGVSRRHCEIRLNQGRIEVKDLGSSNGTYVNRRRIDETSLSPGDELRIGCVAFVVRIDGSPRRVASDDAGVLKPPTPAGRRSDAPGGSTGDEDKTEMMEDADVLSALAEDAEENDPVEDAVAALKELRGS